MISELLDLRFLMLLVANEASRKLETTDSRFSNDDSSGRSHIEGEAIIVPRATLEHIAPPEGFLPAEHGEPNTNVPGGYLKMLKRNFDENGWSDEPDGKPPAIV